MGTDCEIKSWLDGGIKDDQAQGSHVCIHNNRTALRVSRAKRGTMCAGQFLRVTGFRYMCIWGLKICIFDIEDEKDIVTLQFCKVRASWRCPILHRRLLEWPYYRLLCHLRSQQIRPLATSSSSVARTSRRGALFDMLGLSNTSFFSAFLEWSRLRCNDDDGKWSKICQCRIWLRKSSQR